MNCLTVFQKMDKSPRRALLILAMASVSFSRSPIYSLSTFAAFIFGRRRLDEQRHAPPIFTGGPSPLTSTHYVRPPLLFPSSHPSSSLLGLGNLKRRTLNPMVWFGCIGLARLHRICPFQGLFQPSRWIAAARF